MSKMIKRIWILVFLLTLFFLGSCNITKKSNLDNYSDSEPIIDIVADKNDSTSYRFSDLKNYPDFFLNNESIRTIIVIPSNGEIRYFIMATDIISGLDLVEPKKIQEYQKDYVSLLQIKILKDSEVIDHTAFNVISIGNSCINNITKEILGNSKNCLDGEGEGKGRIILTNNWRRIQLVVSGFNTRDALIAANVLGEHLSHNLSGSEIYVTATDSSLRNPKITKVK